MSSGKKLNCGPADDDDQPGGKRVKSDDNEEVKSTPAPPTKAPQKPQTGRDGKGDGCHAVSVAKDGSDVSPGAETDKEGTDQAEDEANEGGLGDDKQGEVVKDGKDSDSDEDIDGAEEDEDESDEEDVEEEEEYDDEDEEEEEFGEEEDEDDD